MRNYITFAALGAISSAGSEHYLDKVGVTGSNPVSPTIQGHSAQVGCPFFISGFSPYAIK